MVSWLNGINGQIIQLRYYLPTNTTGFSMSVTGKVKVIDGSLGRFVAINDSHFPAGTVVAYQEGSTTDLVVKSFT